MVVSRGVRMWVAILMIEVLGFSGWGRCKGLGGNI